MEIRALLAAAALALLPLSVSAYEFPVRLEPPAPFPALLHAAPTFERIAPGVSYAEYDLETADGPLAVRVVAVAPLARDVRIGTVLAHDTLVSAGERVSEMANRTGAVAGINGDYFDTSNNHATNIVVSNGRFLNMPRKRYSLAITDRGAQFVESTFSGEVQLADRTVPLDLVNEMPSTAAVALITPEYGTVPAHENLTLVALQPLDGTPPFMRYRVAQVQDNLHDQPPGYYLAIGMDAYGRTGVPNAGDVLTATGDLSPLALSSVQAAIGGGPLVLQNGVPFDDPDGPSGGEYNPRNPSSAAATTPDGTLLLIQVDGRDPFSSIGVTRSELAALMRALGARDGIALDGGGSSAIAVRLPGERAASLLNSPSDGFERPVADGLFVYSTAPIGPAAHIVGVPSTIHAITGSSIRIAAAAIDDAQHVVANPAAIAGEVEPKRLGSYANGIFAAKESGNGALHLRSGTLRGEIPIHVANAPARIAILPQLKHVPINGSIQLRARGFDEQGYPLQLPDRLVWTSSSGSIDPSGRFTAKNNDAVVAVLVAGRKTEQRVLVGSKERPIAFAESAHFATVPRGGDGSTVKDPTCACVQLNFALGADERAAYAMSDLPLPQNTIGLAFDVRDDGSGANLRVALRNSIGAQVLVRGVTLDRPGWRHVQIALPESVYGPAKLSALYVIGPKPQSVISGSIVLRNVRAVVAGSK